MLRNPLANVGDTRDAGSVLGSERSCGGEDDNPLQFSCLGNPMDKRAWQAIIQGVAKESDTI